MRRLLRWTFNGLTAVSMGGCAIPYSREFVPLPPAERERPGGGGEIYRHYDILLVDAETKQAIPDAKAVVLIHRAKYRDSFGCSSPSSTVRPLVYVKPFLALSKLRYYQTGFLFFPFLADTSAEYVGVSLFAYREGYVSLALERQQYGDELRYPECLELRHCPPSESLTTLKAALEANIQEATFRAAVWQEVAPKLR